jgi:hypothetical protein
MDIQNILFVGVAKLLRLGEVSLERKMLVCRKLGYKMHVHVYLPMPLLDFLKQQFSFLSRRV